MYYTDTDISSPQFWANRSPGPGILDLGSLGSVALNEVTPPANGYDPSGGAFAVIGHVYVVALAEPGHYGIFRVIYIEPDISVTIDFVYLYPI